MKRISKKERQANGAKGGRTTRDKYGPEYYSQIGGKGGDTVKKLYGPEYYAEIARKGQAMRKAKREAEKNGEE